MVGNLVGISKKHLSSKMKSVIKPTIISMRPEGIEPPSQEPESYVISTTLRAQARLLV